MKKIFFAIQAVLITAVLIPANANPVIKKNNKEEKRESRENNREKKRERNIDWVNFQTEQQFYLDFPEAINIEWTHDNFEVASFYDGSVRKDAYYDNDNNLIGTINEADYADLPEKSKKIIEKDYPEYDMQQVIFFKDNPDNDTDMNLYSTSFEDEDSYFIELKKDSKAVVLQIVKDGQVLFFKNL